MIIFLPIDEQDEPTCLWVGQQVSVQKRHPQGTILPADRYYCPEMRMIIRTCDIDKMDYADDPINVRRLLEWLNVTLAVPENLLSNALPADLRNYRQQPENVPRLWFLYQLYESTSLISDKELAARIRHSILDAIYSDKTATQIIIDEVQNGS